MVAARAAAAHLVVGNMDKLLSKTQLEQITQRIATLEQSTDAEVVCAVAKESGNYNLRKSVFALGLGLLVFLLGNELKRLLSWNSAAVLHPFVVVALVTIGFSLGSGLASRWHDLRRLLVSKKEMESEVRRSAHHVFSRYGVGGTRHRGGLLLYLSLFERRLEVRCDSAVAGRVTQEDIDAIRDAVLEKVRAQDTTGGLLAGLNCAEGILSKAIPASDRSLDALPNRVLIFHQRP